MQMSSQQNTLQWSLRLPTPLPSSTTALYISNSSIYSLKPEDLSVFSNALTIFVMKDAGLKEVHPGTLDATVHIGALGFTGSELQDLPEALFQNLQGLESLTLKSNKLLVLRPHWFSSLKYLKVLDLSKNLFTSVPSETLTLLLS